MESDAIVRMAREDTRWFAVAVVILSLVLFLALPITVLMAIEVTTARAQMKAEIREIRRLKEELRKDIKDAANSRGDRSEPNQ